jgi:hypothetical protein
MAEPSMRVSDRSGEFSERRCDPERAAGVDSKLVMTAAQVLDEGMPGDDDLCRPISL